jgi:hypothetical protein
VGETIYWIWGLLPFCLFVISGRAAMRRAFKARGKEYPLETLRSAIYATICMVIAIIIDQYFLDDLLEMIPANIDWSIPRFLVYPFVLLVGALVQQASINKKQKIHNEEMRKRQLDAQRTFNR